MLNVKHPLNLTSRAMTENDLPQVLAIEAQCHSHPWTAANFISSIQSSHACNIVEQDQSIIAYIITSTVLGEAEVLNLSVAPSVQRQGIARALLNAVSDRFVDKVETLFLEVRASNQAAIGLYQSMDFNEVGTRPNYYPAADHKGREDAVIMAKILSSPF